MHDYKLIPNLFRTEYSKIVSVLCKTYGLCSIQHAEDFVSDSFLKASETWGINGVPENPKAWLYSVAKNTAKDYFKRKNNYKTKIEPQLKTNTNYFVETDIDFSENNIKDSQLQMLFSICHPINSNESQIALALRILCGFGVDEIASALLSTKSTINKRLHRAKEKLRSNAIEMSFPPNSELEHRLSNVLSIIYLLFNEGYFSTTTSKTIRKELCFEAMRLLYLLIENKQTNIPKSNALMALFCFHTSRFEARINGSGESILLNDQDKDKWDMDLITKGEEYLNYSARGNRQTKYHFEALIAYYHTQRTINSKEKWSAILQLYNKLLQLEYSPIAALNRTYALSMVNGSKVALKEALKIDLKENHLYHSLLAELYKDIDVSEYVKHLNNALHLAQNENDKKNIEKKLKKVKL